MKLVLRVNVYVWIQRGRKMPRELNYESPRRKDASMNMAGWKRTCGSAAKLATDTAPSVGPGGLQVALGLGGVARVPVISLFTCNAKLGRWMWAPRQRCYGVSAAPLCIAQQVDMLQQWLSLIYSLARQCSYGVSAAPLCTAS